LAQDPPLTGGSEKERRDISDQEKSTKPWMALESVETLFGFETNLFDKRHFEALGV